MIAIVVTKSANMPTSVRSPYRRVAVVLVDYWLAWDTSYQPKMLSTRCKEVHRIIADLGPQSVGKTERCAYQRALARARQIASDWNNARSMAEAEAIIGAGGSA